VARPVALVAAVPPLVVGAAHFNDALARALRRRSSVLLVSWRRMYPPLLYGGSEHEGAPLGQEFLLDWIDPRTWRQAVRRIEDSDAAGVILPWLHPIMTPPYLYLLRRLEPLSRVVICHNVVPHEAHRGSAALTRRVLARADLLITHAPQQTEELARLGLGDMPRLELFHPRFVASDFAPPPDPAEVAALKSRLGDPELLLLCFGAVRPYKGFDLALQALALLPEGHNASLVIAGRFWRGSKDYRRLVERLGLSDRVTLIDRYVGNDEAATLFTAADAVVLPYRTGSQSGVAQLAFAFGTPVIATAVGGLPAAIRDGIDGLLCPPEDAQALAAAIERFACERTTLVAGVDAAAVSFSFDRYAERLLPAIEL
jgi:glycosyltransferase involved in cell wall biosynthesis